MEEKIIDSMDNDELTPAEYAILMLERTDENGILRIPEEHFTDGLADFDEKAERVFEMNWNAEKLKELIETFELLYADIKKIAESCSATNHDSLNNAQIPALQLDGGILDDAVIWRARRLCRLLTLCAPEAVLRAEAQRLIEALVLTRFAMRELRG